MDNQDGRLKIEGRNQNSQAGSTVVSYMLKEWFFPGCSKMPRCKAPEILRSEAYLKVRCNDKG
jgi:hypothetical protein